MTFILDKMGSFLYGTSRNRHLLAAEKPRNLKGLGHEGTQVSISRIPGVQRDLCVCNLALRAYRHSSHMVAAKLGKRAGTTS